MHKLNYRSVMGSVILATALSGCATRKQPILPTAPIVEVPAPVTALKSSAPNEKGYPVPTSKKPDQVHVELPLVPIPSGHGITRDPDSK